MLQNSIHICYFLDVFFISIPLKSVLYCSLGSVPPPEDLLIREEPDMFFRPGKRIAGILHDNIYGCGYDYSKASDRSLSGRHKGTVQMRTDGSRDHVRDKEAFTQCGLSEGLRITDMD